MRGSASNLCGLVVVMMALVGTLPAANPRSISILPSDVTVHHKATTNFRCVCSYPDGGSSDCKPMPEDTLSISGATGAVSSSGAKQVSVSNYIVEPGVSHLFVALGYYNQSIQATSVTYAGRELQKTPTHRFNDGTHAATVETWYLADPPPGRADVIATMSAPTFPHANLYMQVVAVRGGNASIVETQASRIAATGETTNAVTITGLMRYSLVLGFGLTYETPAESKSMKNLARFTVNHSGPIERPGDATVAVSAAPGSKFGAASVEVAIALRPKGTFVSWASDNPAVAQVDENGVATTVAPGSAVITATYGQLNSSTGLTVTDPVLRSVAIKPSALSMVYPNGGGLLQCYQTWTDGSERPCPDPNWKSVTPRVASIDANGNVKPLAIGTATIEINQPGSPPATATVHVIAAGSVPPQFVPLRSDWNIYKTEELPAPQGGKGSRAAFTDSTFDTRMMLLEMPKVIGAGPLQSVVPFYSKQQAWSNDGRYLILWDSQGWPELYDGGQDGRGYRWIRRLDKGAGKFSCSVDPEIRWSSDPRTPHRFYHICYTTFYQYDVDSNKETALIDWGATFHDGGYSWVTTEAEGNPSTAYDPQCDCYDRYWFFLGKLYNSQTKNVVQKDFILYDRASNRPMARVPVKSLNVCPGGASVDWTGMSPSGKHAVVAWAFTSNRTGPGCGTSSYKPDANLSWERTLARGDYHGDVGFDAQGNEAFVTLDESGTPEDYCALHSVRIEDGVRTTMLMDGPASNGKKHGMCDKAPGGGTVGGFHVSMRGTVDSRKGVKGYALISWYANLPIDIQDTYLMFGMGEQDALYLPGDGSTGLAKLYRINKTQSIRKGYGDEPHCSASPDWKKTVCGTNWRNTKSENPVYPLVTELP